MQRYLNHLLADMEVATRNAPALNTYSLHYRPFGEEEDGDRDTLYTRYIRLCELFGLSPDAFPPVERLTKAQVTSLLTALENLWRSWRISWNCPGGLSARRRYTVMVEHMQLDKLPYHYDRGSEINFCKNGCPFTEPDQCSCHHLESYQCRLETDFPACVEPEKKSVSPVEELYRWLRDDEEPEIPYWDEDEDRDRWQQFVMEEDMMAWLYFYRPQADPDSANDDPPPAADDFDDFDWADEEDYGELPF